MSVHTSVCTYVRQSVRPPLRPVRGARGLGQPLRRLSQPLRGLGQPLRGLGQPLRGLRGEGLTGGRMYGQTDAQITPVFYRTSSPPVSSGAAAQKRYFLITEINGKWMIHTHSHVYATTCLHSQVHIQNNFVYDAINRNAYTIALL